MRLKRAKEEVLICKKEVGNYLRFVEQKKRSLAEELVTNAESSSFRLGSMALITSEILTLKKKIEEMLLKFDLTSAQEFRHFFSNAEDYHVGESQTSESELLSDDEDIEAGGDSGSSASFSEISEQTFNETESDSWTDGSGVE